MNLCTECKYHIEDERMFHMCSHPEIALVNGITGRTEYANCHSVRLAYKPCELYVKAPEKASFLNHLCMFLGVKIGKDE